MVDINKFSDSPIQGPSMGPATRLGRYFTDVYNIPPYLHRFWNAVGVMGGLFVGRKVMDVLVGQTISGQDVDKESLPSFLQPLHGCLAYNHFSDDPKDRWMKVLDLMVPTVLGSYGGYVGSNFFFNSGNIGQPSRFESVKAAVRNSSRVTLEAAEDAVAMQQSKPWRGMSGIASAFGSAAGLNLIPGPWNYGTTLGVSFMTVPRNRIITPGMRWITNGISSLFPYGPSSMLPRMIDYAVHNPDKVPQQLETMSEVIVKSWFGKNISNATVREFAAEVAKVRDQFLKEGGVPEELQARLTEQLSAHFKGGGLEDTFRKIGLNPLDAKIGNTGLVGYVAKLLGMDGKTRGIIDNYRKSYFTRTLKLKDIGGSQWEALSNRVASLHQDYLRAGTQAAGFVEHSGEALLKAFDEAGLTNIAHLEADELKKLAGKLGELKAQDVSDIAKLARDRWIAGIGATAGLGAFGYAIGHNMQSFNTKNDACDHPVHTPEVEEAHKHKPVAKQEGNTFSDFINGKPLEFFDWVTDAFNSPETLGKHRVSCAVGLTVGGVVGMMLARILTGRNLDGKIFPAEKVPAMFKPLYKVMEYNPHSDNVKDRWAMIAHVLIPSITGASGVITASNMFFSDRAKKARKAEYIDDYEDKAGITQAQPWTALTSVTSVIATPSGNHFLPLPFPNYGATLGTRYSLMSGRKVIMPGLGKLWTNNHSRYPLAAPKLLEKMIKYATNNPSKDPEQLGEMAFGVLKPWFENVTDQQVQEFVNKLHEVRDKFLKEGGVPEEYKAQCEKDLRAAFRGAGLEKTLASIGLDPEQASLGNNGLSGAIAEYIGAGSPMAELRDEYQAKVHKRKEGWKDAVVPPSQQPADFTDKIKKETPSASPSLSA